MAEKQNKFWQDKPLSQLSQNEWERLCDGCGACCLIQLQDSDTEKRVYTSLVCQQMDLGTCQCRSYDNRFEKVPDCTKVSYELLPTADWLPPTCAYLLRYQGRELFWWHPLISGDPQTVHQAGISVRHWAKSEEVVKQEADFEDHIIEDPFADLRWPPTKIGKKANNRKK